MRLIGLEVILTLGLTLAPLVAEAQQAGKVSRIGVLVASSAASVSPRIGVFRKGLREHGYVEGKNIAFEYRYAEGKLDRYSKAMFFPSTYPCSRRPLRN